MRLFCLPHAGGTSRIFQPWLEHLSPDIELHPLDIAGRGARRREPGPRTFADAVEDLARIVAERAAGDEYALYGHSMGALLAYEAVCRLPALGARPPRLLFAAACRPPGQRRVGPRLHTFPDQAFLGALAAFGGVPTEILGDRESVEFYAALIRDDYRLYEEYTADPEARTLSCPITVIVGSEDPLAPVPAAEGWTRFTDRTAQVQVLDGAGHFFDDRIGEVVAHVGKALAASDPAPHVPAPAAAAELFGRLRLADVRLSATASGLGYAAETGSLDDALLARMAEAKPELLALVAAGGPVEASGPVTRAQRRSIGKLEATCEPAGFNIAMRLSITGPLNVPALERALTTLVARHGALRTRLVRHGGHLVQERMPALPVALPVARLDTLAPAERERAVEDWLSTGARRPFELGRSPLFRAHLARTGPQDWELLLVVQHTVSDAWSNATILRDLAEAYESGADLAPLASDFLDFARWEHERYQGPLLRELTDWWTGLLTDAPLTYQLPYDRPRPPRLSGRGEVCRFAVPESLAEQSRRYAEDVGGTEFAVLFATFLQWLAELSGQRDFTVPVNYANRPRREFEDVVGFFVDNLLVRVELDPAEPFAALVRRVGTALFESVDRFLPFGTVVDRLHEAGKPDLDRFPQVPFVVLNTPPMSAALPGLEVDFDLVETGGSKYEFTFILEPENRGWRGIVPYQSDLFEPETMDAWCAGYVELLQRRVIEEVRA